MVLVKQGFTRADVYAMSEAEMADHLDILLPSKASQTKTYVSRRKRKPNA